MESILSKKNLNVLKSFSIVDTLYVFSLDDVLSSENGAFLAAKLMTLKDSVPLSILTSKMSDLQKLNVPAEYFYILKDDVNRHDSLRELLKRENCSFCVYVGMDLKDEEVFRVRMSKLLTVSIGELKNFNAKYFVKDETELSDFLDLLIEYNSITR